jgi:integrase/recombinase XerD
MTRQHVADYLNSFKKSEARDPQHKWIGSHNLYVIHIRKLFTWLKRPECIEGITTYRRKEVSIYKPSDLWTQEDDLLFLKYCPSKRDKCYHMISRDTSCRPHEILRLKIKDVVFKNVENRQYAEVMVNGKTGSRHIPLINSIPYLKDWLDNHPQGQNPNAYLISSTDRQITHQITTPAIYKTYKSNKKMFVNLLKDKTISGEDREAIKSLLNKPWNPYIRRHSALTDKSKILKEHILRQHAGWSTSSNMPQKYIHWFGNESSESILEAYGSNQSLKRLTG